MKSLTTFSPYLYVLMVLFVIFRNTGYQFLRMFELPYLLYVLFTGVGFWVLRLIIKEAAAAE